MISEIVDNRIQIWSNSEIDLIREQKGLTYGEIRNVLYKPIYESHKIYECAYTCSAVVGITLTVAGIILLSYSVALLIPRLGFIACTLIFFAGIGLISLIPIPSILLKSAGKIESLISKSPFSLILGGNTFENIAAIGKYDLELIVQSVKTDYLPSIVSAMNFEQLGTMRKIFEESKFENLLCPNRNASHYQWALILRFKSEFLSDTIGRNTIEEIEALIKSSRVFARELKEELKDKKSHPWEIMLHTQCPAIEYGNMDKFELFPVIFSCLNKPDLQVNLKLLEDRSEFFKNAADSIENSLSKIILNSKDYDAYNLYFEMLNSENFEITADNALRLLPIADFFGDRLFIRDIEDYISTHSSDINEESLNGLLETHSDAFRYLLNLKDEELCKIKVSSSNWEKMKAHAKNVAFPKFQNKCLAYSLNLVVGYNNLVKSGFDDEEIVREWTQNTLEIALFMGKKDEIKSKLLEILGKRYLDLYIDSYIEIT